MTEILRERNQKFAKAVQKEYEAERIKTQSRYKHLVQERMGVENMKNAGDKPVQGESGPMTAEDLIKVGENLLDDDTSVADERLKPRPPPTWNYEEIEALIADPGNPVPFVDRLPYAAIEKLREDPPKTKKYYRAHFAKQMAHVIARAEQLLGEEARHLPEVKLGEPDDDEQQQQEQQEQQERQEEGVSAPAHVEEDDEWAGFSPAQRAIQETRENVDAAWNAYRYVRSYTTLSDGLVYYNEEKMWPEKLGPAAAKIEAADAKARLRKIGNISYKGIIDMPVWKSKRQLREEAKEAKSQPTAASGAAKKKATVPEPQSAVVKEEGGGVESQEAEELVELFMAGKLF